MKLIIGDHTYDVEVSGSGVAVDGESFDVAVEGFGATRIATVNGRALRVDLSTPAEGTTSVTVEGKSYDVRIEGRVQPRATAARPPASRQAASPAVAVRGAVTAQMTGRVVRVAVAPGDTVAAGDLLLILEAMKMENEIRSTRAGSVTEVRVAPGDRVNQGDPLVVLGE